MNSPINRSTRQYSAGQQRGSGSAQLSLAQLSSAQPGLKRLQDTTGWLCSKMCARALSRKLVMQWRQWQQSRLIMHVDSAGDCQLGLFEPDPLLQWARLLTGACCVLSIGACTVQVHVCATMQVCVLQGQHQ